MVYFISGHRDLTQEEFDANYVPAIDNGQTTWEDCVLHSTCYPLRKGTRVVVSMVSHYTQKGKAGFILETDYRTCLPYCVKWDDGSTSWVIGCTVTPEDSIIEESEEDIEIDFILENGFFREVTFYERN